MLRIGSAEWMSVGVKSNLNHLPIAFVLIRTSLAGQGLIVVIIVVIEEPVLKPSHLLSSFIKSIVNATINTIRILRVKLQKERVVFVVVFLIYVILFSGFNTNRRW